MRIFLLGLTLFFGYLGWHYKYPRDPASYDKTRRTRRIANETAEKLAHGYRQWLLLNDYEIRVRGDSSIKEDCVNGDGWADVDLLDPIKHVTVKLKCSTYSADKGCFALEDFKENGLKDGVCDREVKL